MEEHQIYIPLASWFNQPITHAVPLVAFSVDITVKCPICQTLNGYTSLPTRVDGLKTICRICKYNQSVIYLPICGHICMCPQCFVSSRVR